MATNTNRTTLIVLFGGRSAEHDVSCVTAAHVIAAVDLAKYRVIPVGIDRDGVWHLDAHVVSLVDTNRAALPDRLDPSGDISSLSVIHDHAGDDVVVLPLLHGPLGEDGTIQGLLEILDVPYVGSGVLASSLSMDKAMAKQVLTAAQIPQVNSVSLHTSDVSPVHIDDLVTTLGYPMFVKPANMGSSVGISKAHNRDELVAALDTAAKYDEWIVVEEGVIAREIEVSVLGNLAPRASVPGEIIPSREFYDYEDKYVVDGATLAVPAALTQDQATEVQALALEVYQALRCEGMARVDFFFEEHGRGFLCNEVNTIPGFTPISMYPKLWEASGLSYSDLIDELVSLAQERHRRHRRNTSR
jgi:D-alanine-D-alanine ligase